MPTPEDRPWIMGEIEARDKHVEMLRAALREIQDLPGYRLDECSGIARRTLAASDERMPK